VDSPAFEVRFPRLRKPTSSTRVSRLPDGRTARVFEARLVEGDVSWSLNVTVLPAGEYDVEKLYTEAIDGVLRKGGLRKLSETSELLNDLPGRVAVGVLEPQGRTTLVHAVLDPRVHTLYLLTAAYKDPASQQEAETFLSSFYVERRFVLAEQSDDPLVPVEIIHESDGVTVQDERRSVRFAGHPVHLTEVVTREGVERHRFSAERVTPSLTVRVVIDAFPGAVPDLATLTAAAAAELGLPTDAFAAFWRAGMNGQLHAHNVVVDGRTFAQTDWIGLDPETRTSYRLQTLAAVDDLEALQRAAAFFASFARR
jgi:hypothetical protein